MCVTPGNLENSWVSFDGIFTNRLQILQGVYYAFMTYKERKNVSLSFVRPTRVNASFGYNKISEVSFITPLTILALSNT